MNDDNMVRLLSHLRTIAENGGFPAEQVINREKARNILEATAGDVWSAAQLYWDDFLASRQQPWRNERQEQQNRRRDESSDEEEAEMDDQEEDEGGDEDSHHDEVMVMDDNNNEEEEEEDDDENPAEEAIAEEVDSPPEINGDPGIARMLRRRLFGAEENVSDQNRRRGLNSSNENTVSDDEVGVWKSTKKFPVALRDFSPSTKRRKLIVDDDDGYLSDNDWIWECMMPRDSIPLSTPMDLLWGQQDTDGDEETQSVPFTWLNACLSLEENKEAVGLAVGLPNEEDLAYFCWQSRSSQNIPLPYYCRSLTAISSILTALIYSGASVQPGGRVTCSSSRAPLHKVLHDEARYPNSRELDARLVDAITALLWIASTTSMERKHKALENLHENPKYHRIQRKLKLAPTCWWESDAATSELRPPEPDDDGNTCPVSLATSYTNVQDLRSYVLSNFKSFTSSGGVVLLLETILRIHGRGAVQRMIQRSRSDANLPPLISLLHCRCEERHLKYLQDNPKLVSSLKAKSSKDMLDTTPKQCDCCTVELISLLLTGRVHSTLTGWSTGPLGIGILSSQQTAVDEELMRPTKPVWILQGPTAYSVVWMNGVNDHESTFSMVDRPNTVASLTHWNTWSYNDRHATRLRMVVDRNCTTENIDVVTDEELESVCANAEDQQFYPSNFRMWRYDMTGSGSYKAFFSLTEHQKLVVETKLGPQLTVLLRTRWPRATVDTMEAKDAPDAVV